MASLFVSQTLCWNRPHPRKDFCHDAGFLLVFVWHLASVSSEYGLCCPVFLVPLFGPDTTSARLANALEQFSPNHAQSGRVLVSVDQ